MVHKIIPSVTLNTSWRVTPTEFVILAGLGDVLLFHLPLFMYVSKNLDVFTLDGIQTLVTLLVIIFIVTSSVLYVLFFISLRLVKPVCILLALGNSVAFYFMVNYQVILSKSMMSNVLHTDIIESVELYHPIILAYVLFLGILPSSLILKSRFRNAGRARISLHAALWIMAGIVWLYSASASWLWIDKHAKTLGGMVLPWSYVFNVARYYDDALHRSKVRAALPDATELSSDKTVVVLVIGEAARAANFSLYGYKRNTNPELSSSGAIALPGALSCATYTTAALECILSHSGSAAISGKQFEPLPGYLQRNGVDVIWRTNNWGEPPVAVQDYQRPGDLRQGCEGTGCQYDDVLLNGLAERITSSDRRKILVVLHQKGSHGPAYSGRYPPQFEVFTPVCKSVELHNCPESGLVNAYDNTILYTDHFLARVIETLRKLKNTSALMLYLSDHGESLGEHGLYLHGAPFSIAPDEQKQIPFIIWMSPEFIQGHRISVKKLTRQKNHSQANVFHSVMGALGMSSTIYDPRLDIFSASSTVDVTGPVPNCLVRSTGS